MENNPYESPRTQPYGSPSNLRISRLDRRTVLVTCLYLLVIISGVAQVTRPDNGALRLLLWALPAWSATYWCVIDSRAIGHPIVQSLHWIIFLTWPIAVPAYLVFSRRLRGLGIAVLHAVGLYIVFAMASLLAGYFTYGEPWLRRLHQ